MSEVITSRCAFLHLAGVWTIAVVTPLLELLGRSPEFLVAHQAQRLDILVVVAGLLLAPPAALWAATRVAAVLHPRLATALHVSCIAVLAAAVAAQALKAAGVDAAVSVLSAAALVGACAAVAYARMAWVRTMLSVLAVAVVMVPAVFLCQPQIRRLLFPTSAEDAVGATASRAIPTTVVMVVLDEVPLVSLLDRSGLIDAAHYPHLAQLARDGIWFRNATTVSDYTQWALPAIVSGKYPVAGAAPKAVDHKETLFTLLGPTHRLEVSESVTQLCPASLCERYQPPFASRLRAMTADLTIVYLHVVSPRQLAAALPPLTDDWAHFGTLAADRHRKARTRRLRRAVLRQRDDNITLRVTDRANAMRQFADRIAQDAGPRFYFIHSMVSHSPHITLPTGQFNGTLAGAAPLALPRAEPGRNRETWRRDEWPVAQMYQRHLLQLGFADRLLGDLLARLRATAVYDDALLIVVSDHGSTFRPGTPRRAFTDATAAEIVRVPLIVKFPSGRSPPALAMMDGGDQRISDINVETVDLAPTVADVLGIELPWRADGQSILDRSGRRQSKQVYFDSARSRRSLSPDGPDMRPALAWKLSMFGTPGNKYRVPRPEAFGTLVGKRLAELKVHEGDDRVRVDFLGEYQQVDLTDVEVPFDVAGRFERTGGDGQRHVAVAVNGVVQAVTRTWADAPDQWLATPPLESWRDGSNDLEVLVVTGLEDEPRLERAQIGAGDTR